jgi:hypothetical protein
MIHGREKPIANSTTKNSEANERNYQTQKEEDLAQKFKALYGKKENPNPWWPSAVALFEGGGGLSVEFGGGVELRRWWFFRAGWTLERENQKLHFFFNKIRCFHVYFI